MHGFSPPHSVTNLPRLPPLQVMLMPHEASYVEFLQLRKVR